MAPETGPGSAPGKRQAAERRGRTAELIAAGWLMAKGYSILERRLKTPVGEIDLIARRGLILAMVEVKHRADVEAGIVSLGPRQQQRIMRAAQWYLAGRPSLAGLDLRFDMVVIAPGAWPRHIRGGWESQ